MANNPLNSSSSNFNSQKDSKKSSATNVNNANNIHNISKHDSKSKFSFLKKYSVVSANKKIIEENKLIDDSKRSLTQGNSSQIKEKHLFSSISSVSSEKSKHANSIKLTEENQYENLEALRENNYYNLSKNYNPIEQNANRDNFAKDFKSFYNSRKQSARRDNRKKTNLLNSNSKLEIGDNVLNNNLDERKIDTSQFNLFKTLIKLISYIIVGLIMIDIVLLSICSEYSYDRIDNYLSNQIKSLQLKIFDEQAYAGINEIELSPEENIYRLISIVLALMRIIGLIICYNLKISFMIKEHIISKHDNIYTSGLLKYFILECIIQGICLPPYVNHVIAGYFMEYYYLLDLNSIILITAYVRLYYFYKIYLHFSKWTSDKAISVCNKYGIKRFILFSFKSDVKNRPYTTLTIIVIFFTLIFAALVRIGDYSYIEKGSSETSFKEKKEIQNFSSCLWLIAQSMTTVGYGDVVPISTFGRIIGVLACMFGMIIISLIVIAFEIVTEFSPFEKDAYLTVKKTQNEEKINQKAAYIIKQILLLKQLKKEKLTSIKKSTHNLKYNNYMNDEIIKEANTIRFNCEKFIILSILKTQACNFMNKLAISKYYSVPLQQQFHNVEDEFKKSSFKIKKLVESLTFLDEGINKLNTRLNEVNLKFDSINANNNKISNYLISLNNKKLKALIKKNTYQNKSSQILPFESRKLIGINNDSIVCEKANQIDELFNLRYNNTNYPNEIHANSKVDDEIV